MIGAEGESDMKDEFGSASGLAMENSDPSAAPLEGFDLSVLELSDVIDSEKIQLMMDAFFKVTALPVSLIDTSGRVLVGVGWQDICTSFHRVHPETCANCVDSDTRLTEGIEPGKFTLYKCKNGMWDIATPIMVMGRKLGNIFMGQFFFEDEEIDLGFFRKQAHRYGFEVEKYMEALGKVPRFSRDEIHRAMSFFVSLAAYLSEQGLSSAILARSIQENRVLMGKLSSREALQRLAGELASLGWWTVELPEYISVWSDEVARIHEMPSGFTPTVEQGISFYAPEYRGRISEVFERCVSSGEPYDEEMQIITRTGRRVWVRTMGVPEMDAAGNIVRVLGGFQDISELKKAQEDLASSRERFDLFLNSSKDMAFLKDADMRLILANDSYLEFLGRTREEVIGRSDYELLPAPLAEQCSRGDEEVLRRGENVVSEEHGGDRIYETMKFPVCFRDGTAGVGGFVRDVTDLRKAEEALKESEERFRGVFENATVGLYRTSPDGKILMANPSLVKMLGYSSFDELASRDLSQEGFEPDYSREHFQRRIENEGEIMGLESAWTRRDGTVLFVRESARAVRGADGNILHYEGTVEDITERKAAEDALRSSEAKYRRITENISDVVWTADLDMNTTYISPSIEKLIGEPPLKHVKRSMEEKFPPYDLQMIRKVFAEEMEKEKDPDMDRNRTRLVEARHYRADGSLVWISMNMSFIRDENGRPVGFQGVTRDISAQKEAEASLNEQRLRLENVIKGASVATWEWNVQTGEMTVNEIWAQIIGYTLEELSPVSVKTWEALIHPEDLKGVYERLDLHIEGKLPYYDCEIRKKHRNGSWVWVYDRGTIMTRTADGRPLVMFGTYTDITERKIAEEKLRRALGATIEVLTQVVERRDPYTAGHQRRVAALAAEIALAMGISVERSDEIRMTGYVHDIGKISVPAEILSKPGKLSVIEMNIIKEHPQNGREILQDVDASIPLAEIVYQHHERLDGSGYPKGLKGEDILLEARILAVADVVEAIFSNRPYRPAKGLDAALEEIERNRGILYDPQVVDVCLELFREKGYALVE